MKSKIKSLETQITQYKENMEDMKNQHDDHIQELNDQIEQARTDTARQLNDVYKKQIDEIKKIQGMERE